MVQAGGQAELEKSMIRPHLAAGDALLFDCRILHFGIANQSDYMSLPNSESNQDIYRLALEAAHRRNRTENLDNSKKSDIDVSELNQFPSAPCIRPILYINYTHQWFQGCELSIFMYTFSVC